MRNLRKSSATKHEFYQGSHRFEHWYRDNTVYFITSKTREGAHLFLTPGARTIFWERFNYYTALHGFVPWVTTLMSNHYHTLGYLKVGEELGEMMRKLHGSVAWLVMKELDVRHVPFWRERSNRDYFDGCIRDVLQARRAFRYTLMQSVRARLVTDWREYEDTVVNVELERGIRDAVALKAFLDGVPYARYERRKRHGHQR